MLSRIHDQSRSVVERASGGETFATEAFSAAAFGVVLEVGINWLPRCGSGRTSRFRNTFAIRTTPWSGGFGEKNTATVVPETPFDRPVRF